MLTELPGLRKINVKQFHIPKARLFSILPLSGATGFVGSVLLEQLLRVCSTVQRIYVLIRPKHGLTGPAMPRSA